VGGLCQLERWQVDRATEEGPRVALLGEPHPRHAGGTVHGRGGDLRRRHFRPLSGGHLVAVEPDGGRPADGVSHQGHAEARAQPAGEHNHGVQDARGQSQRQFKL